MQRAYTIFATVPCLSLLYLSTLFHKCLDFRKKKKLMNMKWVFWFSSHLLSETCLILRRKSELWWQIYIGPDMKYLLFLSDLSGTWIFSTEFRKILKYQISWKSIQLELSSMLTDSYTDGRADMAKLIVVFPSFSNAPKKDKLFPLLKAACNNRDM